MGDKPYILFIFYTGFAFVGTFADPHHKRRPRKSRYWREHPRWLSSKIEVFITCIGDCHHSKTSKNISLGLFSPKKNENRVNKRIIGKHCIRVQLRRPRNPLRHFFAEQRYCSTKSRNFTDVCMVRARPCPPPYQRL